MANNIKIDNYTLQVGWATQFSPTAKFPVIDKRIFHTKAEADSYLKDNSAIASAIPGLILTVIEDTTANNGAYLVTGTDGNLTLKKLAEGDNLSADLTITVEKNTNGNYDVKQGNTTVGTIEIPKDLVVKSGSVVNGTWSGNNFTEGISGTGKAIKLVLNIEEGNSPIYINVADLVDVYTTGSTTTDKVRIAVSNDNKITATITPGSIEGTDIKEGTITESHFATSVETKVKEWAAAAVEVPLKGVQVNGTDVAITDKKANLKFTEGTTTGTFKVNDTVVTVHDVASKADLDSLSSEMETVKGRVDDIESDVEDLQDKCEELEESIDAIPGIVQGSANDSWPTSKTIYAVYNYAKSVDDRLGWEKIS